MLELQVCRVRKEATRMGFPPLSVLARSVVLSGLWCSQVCGALRSVVLSGLWCSQVRDHL